VGGRGWSPFSGSAVANSDFLKAALKLYPKKVASRPSGRQRFPRRKGNLKFYLPSSFPLLLKSPSNFPSYKKDEFASSSRLIPMLPLPAPAKLPLHDSESFSETPQGEPGSVFQLPQIPVVHSKKCPNYSSPPQIRDEVLLFNVSSMNFKFTRGFSKFQGEWQFIFKGLGNFQAI
jgi:hypothetical protein